VEPLPCPARRQATGNCAGPAEPPGVPRPLWPDATPRVATRLAARPVPATAHGSVRPDEVAGTGTRCGFPETSRGILRYFYETFLGNLAPCFKDDPSSAMLMPNQHHQLQPQMVPPGVMMHQHHMLHPGSVVADYASLMDHVQPRAAGPKAMREPGTKKNAGGKPAGTSRGRKQNRATAAAPVAPNYAQMVNASFSVEKLVSHHLRGCSRCTEDP